MKTYALAALSLLALCACADLSTSVVCPGEQGASLVIEVVEAQTGRSVAHEAFGSWSTTLAQDSLRHVSTVEGRVYLAAYGPPGTYRVSIMRMTGPEWFRGDITVVQGTCGPATRNLTAMLAGQTE